MIINTTLIRINHANKCLNTELKLVDENAPIPTLPTLAVDHSFL